MSTGNTPSDAADGPLREAMRRYWGFDGFLPLQAEARRQGDAMKELSARYGVPLVAVPWTSPPPESIDDLCDLVHDRGIFELLSS